MSLIIDFYKNQKDHWPRAGRHILAQYDSQSIVVYQAYRPDIANFAVSHGYFGGEFSFSRMSWIKTNFLWMMYRSGWGTKENQEVTLAIRLKRDQFDEILRQAVHTRYVPEVYDTVSSYNDASARALVRLQWDPD